MRGQMSAPTDVVFPDVTPNIEFPKVSIDQSEEVKNAEYARSALTRNDEKMCDMITQETKRVECRDNIFLKRATDAKKLELCEQITTEKIKQSCRNPMYFSQALDVRDAELCKRIEGDDRYRQDCISRITLEGISSAK